jgi:hypothetical protein
MAPEIKASINAAINTVIWEGILFIHAIFSPPVK